MIQTPDFSDPNAPAAKLRRRILAGLAPTAEPIAAPSSADAPAPMTPAPFAAPRMPGLRQQIGPVSAAPIVDDPVPPPGPLPPSEPVPGPIPPGRPAPPREPLGPAPLPPADLPGRSPVGPVDPRVAELRSRIQTNLAPVTPPPDPTLPPGSTPPYIPPPVNTPAQPPNPTQPGPPDPTVVPPPVNMTGDVITNTTPTGPSPGNGWSAGSQYAMPGWDQSKWADPNKANTSAKYQGGHAMSALGAASVENLKQVADYLTRQGHQVQYTGGDIITVDGIPIDAIKDVGGAGAAWQWEPAGGGGDAGQTGPITSAGGPMAGAGPDASSGELQAPDGTIYRYDVAGNPIDAFGHPVSGVPSRSGTTAAAEPAAPDWVAQIRQMLMDRLKAAGEPVDENAAGITGAVSALRDENTRESQNERTALAERAYAQGGGGLQSGLIGQQIQQSAERNATAQGGLRATLIMKEFGRKQTELQNLLQMAMASGDSQMARDVQERLAALEAELRREGLGVDLAKYQAYLDQTAALAGLNG